MDDARLCHGQRLPSAGDSTGLVLSPLSSPLRDRALLHRPVPKPGLGLGRREATDHTPSQLVLGRGEERRGEERRREERRGEKRREEKRRGEERREEKRREEKRREEKRREEKR